MNEKTLGFVLLASGIIIMLVAALQIYFVFTGKQEPYPLFQTKSVSLNMGDMLAGFKDEPVSQQVASKTPPIELIRGEDLNRSFNMTVHFFLMSFIATIGFKIASLGTNLVRPIVIKAKEDRKEHRD